MTSILDRINEPGNLKELNLAELEQLAEEIRQLMVQTVSLNGGHLASSLGAVELTIGLHRVFNSPEDKIVWDVGHQSYAHKILTGRRQSFNTLRQYGGISGFPVRTESPHDAFGVGHAGTSVSAALGMAVARDLAGKDYNIVAVIGDGSLGAGMALEAMNHAGHLGTKLTIILNDNGMSISPSVGALSHMLNRVRFNPTYEYAKKRMRQTITQFPLGESIWSFSKKMKGELEKVLLPGAFWEELGFIYLGPVDGHDIADIEAALNRARNFESKPTVVHLRTTKGKGYAAAEANATRFHGVSPKVNETNHVPSYSQVFGKTVLRLLKENKKVVAITAAMLDGTGLAEAAAKYPDRVIDVGICEQHAVTLAAGLATQGYIPIVAIYSTFLQRAYDQIIHDVCLQNLPVVFALDRAGIVGDDGKTHQGNFDISYLRLVPNMVIASPKDEDELQHLLFTAIKSGKPMAVRYPRGNGLGTPLQPEFQKIQLGRGDLLQDGTDMAVVAIGWPVRASLEAAQQFEKEGIHCAVANARFAKPIDEELILDLASRTGRLVTIEENSAAGGFGSAVLEFLSESGLGTVKVRCLALPDCFIEHGPQSVLRSKFCIDSDGIVQKVKESFPELFSRSPAPRRKR